MCRLPPSGASSSWLSLAKGREDQARAEREMQKHYWVSTQVLSTQLWSMGISPFSKMRRWKFREVNTSSQVIQPIDGTARIWSHIICYEDPLHCTLCFSAMILVHYLPKSFHRHCLTAYLLLNQLCPDLSIGLESLSPPASGPVSMFCSPFLRM